MWSSYDLSHHKYWKIIRRFTYGVNSCTPANYCNIGATSLLCVAAVAWCLKVQDSMSGLYFAFLVLLTTQSTLQHSLIHTMMRGYHARCHLLIRSNNFSYAHSYISEDQFGDQYLALISTCRPQGPGMNNRLSDWWTTTLSPEPQSMD